MKTYYRYRWGHMEKRNWSKPKDGWHSSPALAIGYWIHEMHDRISVAKESLAQSKKHLRLTKNKGGSK